MKVSLFSLIWLLLISTSMAESAVLPKPVNYVTDKAGVLKDGGSALNERLKRLQDDTTAQVVVYIDKKLPANTTIEDVAVKSFRSWGVGQKDKNNGLALFVFVDDRKMRLEVGYGLEGRVPDLVAKRVLDTMLKPAFKQQKYGEGIALAVNELARLVQAESGSKAKATTAAGSKESQHGPFGGSASSLPSSSSSASTAQSSTSSSSNSSVISSEGSSTSSVPSPAAEVAAEAAEPQLTSTKLLLLVFVLPLVVLSPFLYWSYRMFTTKREAEMNARREQERLQRELFRRREEEIQRQRTEIYQGAVAFQPVSKRTTPLAVPRSTTPVIKPAAKPLAAAAAAATAGGAAAIGLAELARRRRLQEEEEAESARRRRRQEEDDESSRRSSSSWSSSSSESSFSSSNFDSGGGSSGGGGASSDW